MIPAGQFSSRVVVQEKVLVSDGAGGTVEDWRDRAEVWASVTPLSGRETLEAQRVESSATHRVQVRYAGVVPFHVRFKLGTRILLPIGPRTDMEERHAVYEFLCEEVGPQVTVEAP